MTHYPVTCCDCPVADIEVDGARVTIHPPPGEGPFRLMAPPKLEQPNMKVEYHTRDRVHAVVSKEIVRYGRHVSEAVWGDHSSWVLRCASCGCQFEVAEASLPRLGHVLTAGDWAVTNGVVPLRVLGSTFS